MAAVECWRARSHCQRKMNEEKKNLGGLDAIAKYAINGGKAGSYERITQEIAEYVGRTYGYQMRVLVSQLVETPIDPPELAEKPTEAQKMIWGKEYDSYLKKRDKYDDHKAKVFVIILGQCEEPMKNRIEGMNGYTSADTRSDVVELLKMIKDASYGGTDMKYPAKQAAVALRQLMGVCQSEKEHLTLYYKRFQSLIERVELSYGVIAPVGVAERNPKYSKAKDQEKMVSVERDRLLAYLFVAGAKRDFKPMLRGLDNDYMLGDDRYPDTVEEALQVLMIYEERNVYKKKGPSKKEKEDTPGLSFAQREEMYQKGLCFKCGKKGHKARECKEPNENSEQHKAQSTKEEEQNQVHIQTDSWCI